MKSVRGATPSNPNPTVGVHISDLPPMFLQIPFHRLEQLTTTSSFWNRSSNDDGDCSYRRVPV